jgi:hypothetical protein
MAAELAPAMAAEPRAVASTAEHLAAAADSMAEAVVSMAEAVVVPMGAATGKIPRQTEKKAAANLPSPFLFQRVSTSPRLASRFRRSVPALPVSQAS